MKKVNKKIIIGIMVCVLLSFLFWGFFMVLNSILNPEPTIISESDKYQGRDIYFADESEDFNSHLLIFPDVDSDKMNIIKYYFEYIPIIFSSSYDIYLEYSMEAENYEQEKTRIENLSVKYDGKENKLCKIDNISEYDIYIASCMEGHAYEYALFDDANKKIVCVYSQVHEPKATIIPEQYLLDMNIVQNEVGKDFSIYYFKKEGNAYVLPELSGDEVKSTWYPNN